MLRQKCLLTLLALVSTLVVLITPGVATAVPSTPPLQWPAVNANPVYSRIVTSPNGEVTVGCSLNSSGQDLITYSPSGAVVRQISRITSIDGVSNCIGNVIADKNNVIYGVPYGQLTTGGWGYGPNLLAYSGNTLKWKYPITCTNSQRAQYAVGATGNIYATNRTSDGVVHLIGLAPELAVGQTQPTKVLDVGVGNDCTTQIFPYRDGVMLWGQSSRFRYYSYNGKLLAQPSGVPNPSYARMGADGQLFSYSTVGGSFTSVAVSAYDPRSDQARWTTTASTSGANTNGAWLYPIIGGVVVVVYEQKMIGGVPASPTQWVYTMTTLNSFGFKVQSVQLPNVDASGNAYDTMAPTVIADTTGKILMVRRLNEATVPLGSYPGTVPAVIVNVIDPFTSTVTYSGAWRGNNDRSVGQLYGYVLDYAGENGPVSASGTAFLQIRCYNACTDSTTKLYPAVISGLGMDYPRRIPPRPSSPYVALGDSFSSGEGVPPFESGTDIPDINTCHRSVNAYARQIAGSSPRIPALSSGGFRACSGATTESLWDIAQANESIQLDWSPDPSIQLVTLTIGGNDIGFVNFASACVFGTCDVGSTEYNNSLNKINNILPGRLETTYRKILQYAPNAQIYVLGYPQVVANKSLSDPHDIRCLYMEDGNSTWGDARAARAIVSQLNAKILQKVNDTRAESTNYLRLRYVPLDGANSIFNSHEVCGTGTSWFQNVDEGASNRSYVFHPNNLGQGGFASVAASAINAE